MPSADRSRPYRSELRTHQAEQTRLRVVTAAAHLFAQEGYRATTLADLAREAGVSVKTVQEHGPKSALLLAAVELASLGVEGETNVFDTGFGKAIMEVRDPDELAALVGSAMVTINAPSVDMWMTFVAAGQDDAELTEAQHAMVASIRGQVERVLRYVDERGWLRADVPFDDLVETVCIITSVETYARFVQVDGKSRADYSAFVSRMMRETVFVG
jgi:AcrR family transcriptional regulator